MKGLNMQTTKQVVLILTLAAFMLSGCKGRSAPTDNAAAAASNPSALKLSLSPCHNDAMDADSLALAQKMINDGVIFLLANVEPDGGWSMGKGVFKPAATALALKVLVQHPDFGPQHPVVKKGYEVLLTFRQKDGGIYSTGEGVNNYTTALAVMALAAGGNPQHKSDVEAAVNYLRGLQNAPGSESPDGRQIGSDDPDIGGVNYGRKQGSASFGHADLSNVSMWIDAMHEAGVQPDDPAMQRAADFVSRLQNRSESNSQKFAAEGSNDGGFVYTITESKAGAGPTGAGLRSYGSMTYAGFKSMLYAGVSKDDPRVLAAFEWIRRYWRLDSNPNMPQAQNLQGLYYYYHMMAKALRAWGQPIIKDLDGKSHNWRNELVDALSSRVSPDGSWSNDADRWEEGSPILVTAYSVLALQEMLKK